MIRKLFFILIVLLPEISVAQPITRERLKNTDSLKAILPRTSGQERADLMNKIAHSVHLKNPEEAYQYAQKALNLSDSLGYNQGKVVAIWLLSFGKQNYADKLKMLYQAKKYFNDSMYWVVKYKILYTIAVFYAKIDEPDSAIANYRKAFSEIPLPEGFYSFYITFVRLSDMFNLNCDYKSQLDILKKLYDAILRYGYLKPEKKYFVYAGKLGGFYTRHGYYRLAIQSDKRILDSIDGFNFDEDINSFLKAKFLGNMARAYNHWGKYDSALVLHDSSIVMFEKAKNQYNENFKVEGHRVTKGWRINLANQIEGKAIVQMNLGMYDSSRVNFERSMDIRKDINDTLGIAMCLDGLGELCQVQGQYPKALKQLDKAIKMKKDYRVSVNLGRSKQTAVNFNKSIDESISISYFNKGKLFYDWGKYDMSLEQFNNSLELCRKVDYVWGEAKVLLRIGDIYSRQDSLERARESYQKAYDIFIMTDNRPGKAQSLAKLGDWNLHSGNTDRALNYYNRALEIFKDIGLLKDIAETCSKMGGIYVSEEKYGKAISQYENSIKIATPLNLTKCLMSSHKGLSDIYSGIGMTGKAFEHYKKFIAARDTLFTLEANRQIANLEAMNLAQKKESEVKVLTSENDLKEYKLERSRYLLISVGGLAILLIVLAVLYFRQEKLKVSQKNILLEQQLLRTQMNPHFIFNALTNIQSFMYLNKPREAATYLTTFAGLMRNILDNSKKSTVTLDKEIATISNYLKLQKLRLGEKLDYTLEVDEAIDTESVLIPPMLAQPFIENAIEHGIIHKEGNGKVDVKFMLNGSNSLVIEVNDNGVGREMAGEIEKGQGKVHTSMATSITKNRLKNINKKAKNTITLNIIDLKDGNNHPSGTKVVISIPEIYV